jgi:hypothetical protein
VVVTVAVTRPIPHQRHLLAVSVVIALLLGACSGGENGTPTTSSTPPTPSPRTVTTTTRSPERTGTALPSSSADQPSVALGAATATNQGAEPPAITSPGPTTRDANASPALGASTPAASPAPIDTPVPEQPGTPVATNTPGTLVVVQPPESTFTLSMAEALLNAAALVAGDLGNTWRITAD